MALLHSGVVNPFICNADNRIASELCAHNYRQMKFLKKYEYLLLRDLLKGKHNVLNTSLDDDEDQSKEESELHHEMNENIQVFEGLCHKALTVSRTLCVDVVGR